MAPEPANARPSLQALIEASPKAFTYDQNPLIDQIDEHRAYYGGVLEFDRSVMLDHTCICTVCHPEVAPSGPRFNARPHYGLRFFDRSVKGAVRTDQELKDAFIAVHSYGQKVKGAVEVIAGHPGIVWAFRGVRGLDIHSDASLNGGPRHVCASCRFRTIKERLVSPGYQRLYAIEQNATGEYERKLITPKLSPCFGRFALPGLTTELAQNARELLAEQERAEEEELSAIEAARQQFAALMKNEVGGDNPIDLAIREVKNGPIH